MARWKTWLRCPFCGRYLNQGKASYTPGKYPFAVRQFLGGRDSSGRSICDSPEPLSDQETAESHGGYVKNVKLFAELLSKRLGIWPQISSKRRGTTDESESVPPRRKQKRKVKPVKSVKLPPEPKNNRSVSIAALAAESVIKTKISVETTPVISSGSASIGQIFFDPPVEILEKKQDHKK